MFFYLCDSITVFVEKKPESKATIFFYINIIVQKDVLNVTAHNKKIYPSKFERTVNQKFANAT